jgi:hypothetical protein
MKTQLFDILTLPLLASLSLATSSCVPSPLTGETDGGAVEAEDDAGDVVIDAGVDARPDMAQVFPTNPVATPELVTVDLQGVADDAAGALMSAIDDAGIRKLRVVSCVDEAKTVNVPGMGTQRICTLKARADKDANGDFVHDDWEAAASGVYDDDDIHAEVSLYFHASRFYEFITSEEVGLFDHLPGRHMVGGRPVPITLVANYRAPAPASASSLSPIDVALYMPRELGALGLWQMNGIEGITGDALLFGQGPRADFAYCSETVFHEFGHLVNRATAGLGYAIHVDAFGLSNVTNALEQGMAETMVSLVSGRTALFDYLDHFASPGFLRDVDNERRFPDDVQGIDQTDGLIVAGANHEVFLLLEQQASMTPKRFMRVILQSLMDLAPENGDVSFAQYATAFLSVLEREGLAAHVPAVEQILVSRGLFDETRAKDITHYDGTSTEHALFFGSATIAPWNTTLTVEDTPASNVAISPALVQTFVDMGAHTALHIRAVQRPMAGMMFAPAVNDVRTKLYVRRGAPVHYTVDGLSSNQATVTRDDVLEPIVTVENAPSGPIDVVTWQVDDLEPESRVYVHVVNYGASAGALMGITVERTGE